MTLEELFLRAMSGHIREVQCQSLIFMYLSAPDDMPLGQMAELQDLINELGVDLEDPAADEARWTPSMSEET